MPGPPAPQPGSTSGKQRVHPQLPVCFFYLEYRATPNNIWAFSEVKSRIFLVTGANALVGGGPTPQPCTVSCKVVWSGVDERLTIRNDDPVFGGFAGEFVRNTAQLEWRANIGDLLLVSDPLTTSSSAFAEIGHERNRSFFPE